jgi:hypothetical protein
MMNKSPVALPHSALCPLDRKTVKGEEPGRVKLRGIIGFVYLA